MKKILFLLLLCGSTMALRAQTINGPESFCNSTATYYITGAPAGASIVWNTSNSSVAYVSSSSGTSCTVTSVSRGYISLGATVNGNVIPSKTVATGSIAAVSAVQSGSCSNGYMTWLVTATPTSPVATNYQWTVDDPSSGTYTFSSPNSASTYVTVKGGGYVSVSYTDACGLTSMYSGALVYSPCPQ